MQTILLISGDKELHATVRKVLDDCALLVAVDDQEALGALGGGDVDVVLRDTSTPGLSWGAFLTQVHAVAPFAPIVALGPVTAIGLQPDVVLPRQLPGIELQRAVAQISDQRLRRELEAMRTRATAAAAAPFHSAGEASTLPRGLTEFTRAFTSGYDRPRALQVFLDAVADLLRPTRIALLLPDRETGHYVVAAHRGLAPQVATRVQVTAASPLVRWLAMEGRPARMQELGRDQARDLALVQGVVAVPLLAQGELYGILTVGQPVMGGQYSRADTEVLFELGTHLAAAIRDIDVHDELGHARRLLEQILTHMQSGVITVGSDGRIALVNDRAATILRLTPDVVGQDVRALPSPLGDIIAEAMRSPEALPRKEVELRPDGVWVAVTAYAIRTEARAAVGVAVIDDLTAARELAAQRSRSEQLQLLTSVVATIADEIRNPLQSIRVFMEILQDQYDNAEFRARFSMVVSGDVSKLLRVFDTMGGLIGHETVSTEPVEAASLLREIDDAYEGAEGFRVEALAPTPSPILQADPKQLRKAIVYLVEYLAHKAPPQTPLQTVTVEMRRVRGAPGEAIIVIAAPADIRPDDVSTLFDLIALVPRGLKQVGPAVSYRLIAAMGGRLDYQYRPDNFAFLITLPTVM